MIRPVAEVPSKPWLTILLIDGQPPKIELDVGQERVRDALVKRLGGSLSRLVQGDDLHLPSTDLGEPRVVAPGAGERVPRRPLVRHSGIPLHRGIRGFVLYLRPQAF